MEQIEKVVGRHEYKVKLATEHYCDSPADLLIGGDDDNTDGKFVPNINALKWNNEAWLNINHPLVVNTEQEDFTDGIITLSIGDVTIRYYITPDGKLEYEVIFASRPAQNVIKLDIDFSPNLQFWYQPTLYASWEADNEGLTWEEYQIYDHRPENVEGSYAVYIGKHDNEYKTGKFCHIYRPELTDDNGDKSWADIEIDPVKKELTVTMDRTWLRDAVYPVVMDPYIGYNTQGASNYGSTTVIRGSMTSTDTGGGDTITYYVCMEGYQSGAEGIKLGIYPVNVGNGDPEGETLVEQVEFDITATGWNSNVAGGATLSASTEYWLGFIPEHNNGDVYYDATGGDSWFLSGRTYATEFNATCPGSGSTSTRIWSIYCEYGEAPATGQAYRLRHIIKYFVPMFDKLGAYYARAIFKKIRSFYQGRLCTLRHKWESI